MKPYTDLEQSKKLAEMLPLESADMCHKCIGDESYDTIVRPYSEYHEKYRLLLISKDFNAVPCWSFTALFNVIPEGIIENYYTPNLQKENGKYSIAYGNEELLCVADNPIDACVEMIEELHKLKML